MQGIVKQVRKNIQNISTEGVGLTLILGLVLLIVLVNIFRTIEKGVSNYSVFVAEQELLERKLKKNKELEETLAYYESTETKEILARDVLNLAKQNELLFETQEEAIFFEEQKVLLSTNDLLPNKERWFRILPIF